MISKIAFVNYDTIKNLKVDVKQKQWLQDHSIHYMKSPNALGRNVWRSKTGLIMATLSCGS